MARSQRPSGDPSVGGLLGRQHPVHLVDAGRGGGPLLDTRRQCGDDPHGVRNADSRRLKTATTAHDEDEISRSSCSPTAPTLPIRTRRRNRRHRLGSKSLIEAARTLHAHRITARQRRATLGFGPTRALDNTDPSTSVGRSRWSRYELTDRPVEPPHHAGTRAAARWGLLSEVCA